MVEGELSAPDGRTPLVRFVWFIDTGEWDFPIFESVLHSYVAFSEAAWQGQSVIEYQMRSRAASDMEAFFKELKRAMR